MSDRWERVREPSEGYVHFKHGGGHDLVTLCGLTDWIGRPEGDGEDADRENVNCPSCLATVKYVLGLGKPRELAGGRAGSPCCARSR